MCSFHGTEDEQRQIASAFVRSALGAGDRVVYVANGRGSEAGARLLEQRDVGRGQLVVVDFATVYGPSRNIDLDGALEFYRSESDRSSAEGYPGLRVAIEMGDFVQAMPSLDAVTGWEDTVTEAFGDAGIIGICQYDGRLVDDRAQARIAAAHCAVAADDGTVPRATFTPTQDPWGLAVAGELDVSNTPAFARALRARMLPRKRVHLDLAALGFLDVAALRAVFATAADAPPGSVLVVRRPPSQARRLLELLEWSDARVEVQPQ